MTFLGGDSDVLQRLTIEMFTRGLSIRDIEGALMEATGDRLLSRTAVSQITKTLWADYEAFANRDLSGFGLQYLFLDAVYESLWKQGGLEEADIGGVGHLAEGREVLPRLALGNKESHPHWQDSLRDLVK